MLPLGPLWGPAEGAGKALGRRRLQCALALHAPNHHHAAPPHQRVASLIIIHISHHHAALPSPPQEPFVKLLSLFEGEAAKNNNKMIMDAVSKMPGSYSDPNPNPNPDPNPNQPYLPQP